MNAPQPHTDEEVRQAINILIAHLEGYWGFCKDEDYSFGCTACQSSMLRRQLEGISAYLGDDAPA